MKISKKMIDLLNAQVEMEGYASSYYLSMASWCEVTGYEGSAKFLYRQSEEERTHMIKIMQYLNDVGVGATVPSIKQPPGSFKTLESIFTTSLKNEQAVTASFDKMVELAQKDRDHATFSFLQWFVNEQILEEKTMETILQKFALLGTDKIAVYEADKAIGAMVVVDAPA